MLRPNNGSLALTVFTLAASSGPSFAHPPHMELTSDRIRRVILAESKGYDPHSPANVAKRSDYLSWDDYFLAVAYLSGRRSKDPTNAKGACIVDAQGRIVGIGYDGFPRGCSDDCLPWATKDDTIAAGDTSVSTPWLHTREPYVCHAEINAILNKCSNDVVGGRMFVPDFPTNECAKFIIQSGIQEIIYVKDNDPDSDSSRASRILFEVAGVQMTKAQPTVPSIHISFGELPNPTTTHATTDQDVMEKYLGLLLREAKFNPFENPTRKRSNYLSWDDYFMAISFLSAMRSKDPNTQVGACIVDTDKCIIGIGYNGFPRGCSDETLPWAREGDCELHKKYPYVVHAEVNAILNKCSANVKGATIYVALFPCNECSKVIIQSGIKEVVYLKDTYHDTEACRASRIMFRMAGVKLRQYRPECGDIELRFREELV